MSQKYKTQSNLATGPIRWKVLCLQLCKCKDKISPYDAKHFMCLLFFLCMLWARRQLLTGQTLCTTLVEDVFCLKLHTINNTLIKNLCYITWSLSAHTHTSASLWTLVDHTKKLQKLLCIDIFTIALVIP